MRRFHHLFQERYGMPPTALRRESGDSVASDNLRLRLAYRPPFAWDELLAYLPTRGIPGVETVTAGRYVRTFEIDGRAGWLSVRNLAEKNCVEVTVAPEFSGSLAEILRKLRRLFDLDASPHIIAAHLGCDPRFEATLAAFPGLRIPGAWNSFELSVRAILGQQISVAGATTMAGRLAARYGREIQTPFPVLNRLSFTAEDLAAASPGEIAGIGLPLARAQALHEFALAQLAGKLDFPPATSAEAIVDAMEELPGIGPWTANYIAMRGYSLPDAFPTADVGLLKAAGLTSARELDNLAESWRPWRSYAALHLWRSLRSMP
jgi:AraC family transcriptional regulator of adaptative response / DNA-3-methyladenine glycosylase II